MPGSLYTLVWRILQLELSDFVRPSQAKTSVVKPVGWLDYVRWGSCRSSISSVWCPNTSGGLHCLLSYLAIRRISIYCCYVLFHLFMSRCWINYISALEQIKYHSDHWSHQEHRTEHTCDLGCRRNADFAFHQSTFMFCKVTAIQQLTKVRRVYWVG